MSKALLVMGAILVVFGVWLPVDQLLWSRVAISTTGNVIRVEKEFAGFSESEYRGNQPRFTYMIQYSYSDSEGKKYEGRTTSYQGFSVGDDVAVEYRSDSPEVSRAADACGHSAWLFSAVIVGVGLVVATRGMSRADK